MIEIKNEFDYENVNEKILLLMNKGEDNLTELELKELKDLAVAMQVYEENK